MQYYIKCNNLTRIKVVAKNHNNNNNNNSRVGLRQKGHAALLRKNGEQPKDEQ